MFLLLGLPITVKSARYHIVRKVASYATSLESQEPHGVVSGCGSGREAPHPVARPPYRDFQDVRRLVPPATPALWSEVGRLSQGYTGKGMNLNRSRSSVVLG